MNISAAATLASNNVKQDVMEGVQVKLIKSSRDQAQSTVATLLSSVNTFQPTSSVEPDLGNNLYVSA